MGLQIQPSLLDLIGLKMSEEQVYIATISYRNHIVRQCTPWTICHPIHGNTCSQLLVAIFN